MRENNLETHKDARREAYEKILMEESEENRLPDAVFLSSGGIKKTKDEKFKTLSYSDYDYHGFVSGGKARVISGAELAKTFPELKIVTTSVVEPDYPSHASVMAAELKERGIPEDQIILEEKSIDTITELVEAVKMAARENWKNIAFISNGYHLPRFRETFNRLESLMEKGEDPEFNEAFEKFQKEKGSVGFISAEHILESTSNHYKNLFEKVEKLEAYSKRLEAEKKGLEDLRSGRYRRFKNPNK